LYRRNRYFSPTTGQFTQEDPLGTAGGLNLYGFGGGDPVNFSDPFGLCEPWPVCAIELAGAGARGGTIVGGALGALGGPEGIPVGGAVGRVVGALGGFTVGTAGAIGIYLASKHARGIERTNVSLGIAQRHLDQIGGLGPDDEDPEGKKKDWLRDARKHLTNARKYVEDVKGKSRDELMRRIDQLQQQINRYSRPD
jgi:uncharacterized protein RhaS with RHS repeats